jgi:CHAT domain-containing protein
LTRQWGPELSPSTVLAFQKSMSLGNSNGAFESPPTIRSADPDYRPSTPDVDYSHPFYWAAFVYYGE